jgi:pseudaminic acid biosynthesis-associated methylase
MAEPSDNATFWASDFGDQYLERQVTPAILAANLNFFARALATAGPLTSILELGANAGQNLYGLRRLYPNTQLTGVEINARACEMLQRVEGVEVKNQSLLDFEPTTQFDLVITKTVLIHIAPADLLRAYDILHRATRRYLLIAEYYSPRPEMVEYRGHRDRLFKRDFAGELLEVYPDLAVRDYGFVYRRDKHPQDDVTWFLLEKNA